MEGGFRALLLGDQGSSTSPPAIDSPIDDGYYTTETSQSFLSCTTQEKHFLQLLDYGYDGSLQPQTVDPSSFGYLLGVSPYEEGCGSSMNGGWKSNPADFGVGEEYLKDPKRELSTEPFDFISNGSEPVTRLYDFGSRQLPDLRSLEQFQAGESSRKRAKPSPAAYQQVSTFENLVSNIQLPSDFEFLKPREKRNSMAAAAVPQSTLARQRRQSISEKTRCLQKLLPFEKKMDTATMLGEAYKYIKFLQSQISVLQSMPCDSSRFDTQNPQNNWNAFGGLWKLNRQQLVQVLVNSPVAQSILSSQGRCVYSIEQLALIQTIISGNTLLRHQMMVTGSSMFG